MIGVGYMASSIIGYARISTGDQTLDLQLDALKAAGCTKIYQDQASGVKENRPGLEEALKYIREGDTLVVWKLDRMGRSVKHLIELINRFSNDGIHFKSITESLDTSTSMGKLVYTIMASVAAFEYDIICERTRAGLLAARARGRSGGRREILKPEDVPAFKAMFLDRSITIKKIGKYFKMKEACVYLTAKRLGVASSQRKLPSSSTVIDLETTSFSLPLNTCQSTSI
jgi:DNA invertase Pin-like site-specific DNA recombinase